MIPSASSLHEKQASHPAICGSFGVLAALLVFQDELHARNLLHLNRIAKPTTQCGFWGDMSDGMSCR
jgi:hypothetical protein